MRALPAAADRPRYLTRQQYADELQVDVRTVDRLIADGAVRAVRVRRAIRIPADELDRGAGTSPARR